MSAGDHSSKLMIWTPQHTGLPLLHFGWLVPSTGTFPSTSGHISVHGAVHTPAIFSKFRILRALTNTRTVKGWTAAFPSSSAARTLHVVARPAADLAVTMPTIRALVDDTAVLQGLVTICLTNITVDSPPAGVRPHLAGLPEAAVGHVAAHAEHLGETLGCPSVRNIKIFLSNWHYLEHIGVSTFSNHFLGHGGQLVWGDPGGGLVRPPLSHLLLRSHGFSLLVKEGCKLLHGDHSFGDILHVAGAGFRVRLKENSLIEVKNSFGVDNVVVGRNLQNLNIPLKIQSHSLGVLSSSLLEGEVLHHNLSVEDSKESSKK